MESQGSTQTNYNPLPPPPPPSIPPQPIAKSRKRIIIGIAIAIGAISAALGIFYWQFLYVSECKDIPEGNALDQCYIKIAAERKYDFQTFFICWDIKDQSNKDDCHANAAVSKEKSFYCDKVIDTGKKDGCYFDLAQKVLDHNLCNKINETNRKDDCFIGIAYVKSDFNICKEVQDAIKKDTCFFDIAKVQNDYLICKNIADEEKRDDCYIYIAKGKDDKSICDNVSETAVSSRLKKRDCYCQDTDSGKGYYTKASVTDRDDKTVEDECVSVSGAWYVREYYCAADGYAVSENFKCPGSPGKCSYGACALGPTTGPGISRSSLPTNPNVKCVDTDAGKDYYTKGSVTGTARCIYDSVTQDCKDGVRAYTDICTQGNYDVEIYGVTPYLSENFCGSDGRITGEGYLCPNGCKNGACIK